MTIHTPAVGAATTPAIIKTFFSHYLHKRSRRRAAAVSGGEDPSATSLSYDEGIELIRAFLAFSSKHTLEELQSFTATYVPCPQWVRKEVVTIPYTGCIDRAEELLTKQLESYGELGMQRVGGRRWWRVRGRELTGEWIEMKRDYVKRRTTEDLQPEEAARSERVLLYVHGGAYFFSSLDTHRYQIQRHARKLCGRAFAPSYRLAPQYPFPCGLLDCLASYLFLIDPPPEAAHKAIDPSCIILSGDSAGGGCVLSMLIIIRDLGLPMPAGASLFSPWVDLTHSFPSIMSNTATDYIPGDGFHYKPSLAWPPVRGTILEVESDDPSKPPVKIEEQIQLYCPNALLTHPLVSPVNQGSLGGLCPLLIQSGGGELLRDEQIYLAHKAANPAVYPPSSIVLRDYPSQADLVHKYKSTRVQLQVFDGCAHVIPTLSITVPAKYMYRSAANFNIWAITLAQKRKQRRSTEKSSASGSHSRRSPRSATSHHGGSRGGYDSSLAAGTGDAGRGGGPPSRGSTLDSSGRVTPTITSSPAEMATTTTTTATSESQTIDALNTKVNGITIAGSSSSGTGSALPDAVHERLHQLANAEPLHPEHAQSEYSEEDTSSSSDEPDDMLAGAAQAQGMQKKNRSKLGSLLLGRAATKHEDGAMVPAKQQHHTSSNKITVTGTLPSFGQDKIIRQRVSCHGKIRAMEPASEMPALTLPPDNVGRVHMRGPVKKWLETRYRMEEKYRKDLLKYREIKMKDYDRAASNGFLTRDLWLKDGENPPACSLASWYDPDLARKAGRSVDEPGTSSSTALMLYMRLSQRPDEEQAGQVVDAGPEALERERTRQAEG